MRSWYLSERLASGCSGILSREEKLKIIKALEEDLEFRYAVAGALGILEVLRRLDSIERSIEKMIGIMEEHSRRLEELTKRVEEHSIRLEEHSRRLEELTKRVEEHSKRLEEHSRRLEELSRRVEEHSKRLEEHSRRLEELSRRVEEHSKRLEELTKIVEGHSRKLEELTKIVQGHSKVLEEHGRRLEEHSKRLEEHSKRLEELTQVVTKLVERTSSLEQMIGALSEASIARYVYEDLLQEASLRDERVLRRVRNARIDEVDVDLLVESNKMIYVVEVKVRPRRGDVSSLLSKLNVVSRRYPEKEVIGILAGVWIGREVEDYAREKGIVTYAY